MIKNKLTAFTGGIVALAIVSMVGAAPAIAQDFADKDGKTVIQSGVPGCDCTNETIKECKCRVLEA